MADPMFEGTTLSFAGNPIADMVSLDYTDDRDEVPISGSSDTTEAVLVGCGKETLVAEVIGSPALSPKTKGATVAAWTDGGDAGTFANAELVSITNGGGYNGQITKRLTFRPCNA